MTYPSNKEAAIAMAETLMEVSRQHDHPVTLCVIRRRWRPGYQIVPLAAAKIALGDWYLTDFKRIEWVSLTGHEPKC
jgi:hypothetical protein